MTNVLAKSLLDQARRAAKAGYEAEPFYHGSRTGSTINEFRPNAFFSRDYEYSKSFANKGGGEPVEYRLKMIDPYIDYEYITASQAARAIDAVNQVDPKLAVKIADHIADGKTPEWIKGYASHYPNKPIMPGGHFRQILGAGDQQNGTATLARAGFNEIDTGRDVLKLQPLGIREFMRASFDPSKSDSKNVLAGMAIAAPVTAVGLAANPETGNASEQQMSSDTQQEYIRLMREISNVIKDITPEYAPSPQPKTFANLVQQAPFAPLGSSQSFDPGSIREGAPRNSLVEFVRGDNRDPLRNRLAGYTEGVANFVNALPGFAAELTGSPSINRGFDRIRLHPDDNLQQAGGYAEIASGFLPALSFGSGTVAPQLANALFGTTKRAVATTAIPAGVTATADAALASTAGRNRRNEFVGSDPEVKRYRQLVKEQEDALKRLSSGELKPEDQSRIEQINRELAALQNEIDQATARREAARPKSGAPVRPGRGIKGDPLFFGAEDQIVDATKRRRELEADLVSVKSRSAPDPTAVAEGQSAIQRYREDLKKAEAAANAGYEVDAPLKELYPGYIAAAQGAGIALAGGIGARVGQLERLRSNSAANTLNTANAGLGDAATASSIRQALSARDVVDGLSRKEAGGILDTAKGVASMFVPTSARDAMIAGTAAVPFAAPTILDLARPHESRANEEARNDVADPIWYASKLAAIATANAANKGGQVIGRNFGPTVTPELAPTTAVRNKLGLTGTPDDIEIRAARQQADAMREHIAMMNIAEGHAIAQARLDAARNVQFTPPPPVPYQINHPGGPGGPPQGGPIAPPGGNQGPPVGGPPGGGTIQPPGPPPGPGPGPVGNPAGRTVGKYGAAEQQIARPLIESEVAAGQNVPRQDKIADALRSSNINPNLPQNLKDRLDNAQGIVDALRRQGMPAAEIAKALRSMMEEGIIKGLPALAGAAALYDPLLLETQPNQPNALAR